MLFSKLFKEGEEINTKAAAMRWLEGVQPRPHSNESFVNALTSPTTPSPFPPPSRWKVVKVEEKHRDEFRATKDTSIGNPSQTRAADAGVNRRVCHIKYRVQTGPATGHQGEGNDFIWLGAT